MGACFMVASGFRRTSLVKLMCDWLLKLTNGSFMKVYFGYLLLGVLLTNFMNSPMVVYAIIGPLLCALCDRTGYSRSKYIFPLMVIVVACCFALPLPTSIQKAGEFNGYLETYQFTGLEFTPISFFLREIPGDHPLPDLGDDDRTEDVSAAGGLRSGRDRGAERYLQQIIADR